MSKTSPRSVGSRSVGFRSVGSRSVQYQNFMSFHISKHKHSWGSRLSGREPQVSKEKSASDISFNPQFPSASDISFNPQFPHHGYNGIYMFLAGRKPKTTVFTMFFASGSKKHGIYSVFWPAPSKNTGIYGGFTM